MNYNQGLLQMVRSFTMYNILEYLLLNTMVLCITTITFMRLQFTGYLFYQSEQKSLSYIFFNKRNNFLFQYKLVQKSNRQLFNFIIYDTQLSHFIISNFLLLLRFFFSIKFLHHLLILHMLSLTDISGLTDHCFVEFYFYSLICNFQLNQKHYRNIVSLENLVLSQETFEQVSFNIRSSTKSFVQKLLPMSKSGLLLIELSHIFLYNSFSTIFPLSVNG